MWVMGIWTQVLLLQQALLLTEPSSQPHTTFLEHGKSARGAGRALGFGTNLRWRHRYIKVQNDVKLVAGARGEIQRTNWLSITCWSVWRVSHTLFYCFLQCYWECWSIMMSGLVYYRQRNEAVMWALTRPKLPRQYNVAPGSEPKPSTKAQTHIFHTIWTKDEQLLGEYFENILHTDLNVKGEDAANALIPPKSFIIKNKMKVILHFWMAICLCFKVRQIYKLEI